ncbi:TetR/AcrR family transcriptional regulator [Nakamurella leprariae]|uniref:TetR/AcrR family transcriptional regulator n=1 Tax=Nakamurella leprariae TaxID=2803911 RepID=A0A938YKJ5_9ACTN|nr:TetR/AcrR family transcriptional regulator [Nakamurella leprariae]MBM9469475.1 TetR/AcrR family transcriptional regulator [Nakamurella leprariae]
MGDRRTQIIEAAQSLLAEGDGTLSVRSVAARAGLGASTLRHYFPTQRDLFRAVFDAGADGLISDFRIRDRSVPADERLRECLEQLLPPLQSDDSSNPSWIILLADILRPGGPEAGRTAWGAAATRARERGTTWLELLREEGVLAEGSVRGHTDFLLTVVDGISVSRAVPFERLDPDQERGVLDTAIRSVLRTP